MTVAAVGQQHSVASVLAFVRPVNDAFGLTLVDESDVMVLDRAQSEALPDDGVNRVTFSVDGALVGYATFTAAGGDLACEPAHRTHCAQWLAACKDRPERVWVRGLAPTNWQEVTALGTVTRRLAVCVRTLAERAGEGAHRAGTVVRSFVPEQDADDVVALLARAYAGTPEGTWDAAQYAARLAYPWFRVEDLLLATDSSGTLLGVHWLKRRDEHTGEVYNLAVDPAFAGGGVGALLLHAGLKHLAALGLTHIVLWVDAANAPALALYAKAGFEVHAYDVELELTARQDVSGASSEPRLVREPGGTTL